MNKSGIEWTDTTWNPVTGCTKVSQGCKNCYAERVFPRVYGRDQVFVRHPETGDRRPRQRDFTDVRLHEDRLEQPLRIRKPKRIFVNSMSDLFHESVPDEFIDRVFAVMGTARWHTFQVLTKRPQRMLQWFSEKWQAAPENTQRLLHDKMANLMTEHGQSPPPFKYNPNGEDRFDQVYEALSDMDFCTDPDKDHLYTADGNSNLMAAGWPLPNVWLGVSVEDQATADERIPLLLQTPAAVRFISAEPLLGLIDLTSIKQTTSPGYFGDVLRWYHQPHCDRDKPYPKINWVITGGESGPRARPSHPDWFRSLRDQCAAAGTAFFFKQWGEWAPNCLCDTACAHPDIKRPQPGKMGVMFRCGKKAAGRLLDEREHSDLPA